ncbi:MAG TPA: DUF4142 domain-containing protein [Novosphingobium sp.]|nr:DUF4142 domain-containing protein [Novosphingobium sp.]
MRTRSILCGLAAIFLADSTAFAQQPPSSAPSMEQPLKPLPASAAVEPGSRASADAPSAYALSLEAFRLWAGKNKSYQIAVSRLAMRKARSPETRAYAAHLLDAYANGYATLHNIPPTPTGEPATLTAAQNTMLALLGDASKDFDRLFLAGQIDSQRAAQGIAQSYAVGGIGGVSRAGAAQAVTTTEVLVNEAEDALERLPAPDR